MTAVPVGASSVDDAVDEAVQVGYVGQNVVR